MVPMIPHYEHGIALVVGIWLEVFGLGSKSNWLPRSSSSIFEFLLVSGIW